jgi:hypothetical protein
LLIGFNFTCSGVFPATAAKRILTTAGLALIPTEDKVALMLASSEKLKILFTDIFFC